MNLILCGFRGCGKTTLGKMIAHRLGVPFLDTDQWVSAQSGKSCSQFVRENGEGAFRTLESQAATHAAQQKNHVVALGGGTLFHSDNAMHLQMSGLLIYLNVPEWVLHKRWLLFPPEISTNFEELYKKRVPLYPAWADKSIFLTRWDSPEAALEEIWEAIPLEKFLQLQPGENHMDLRQVL